MKLETEWISATTPPNHSKPVMVICEKNRNSNDVYEARYFSPSMFPISESQWVEAHHEYELYGVIWWAEIPSQPPTPSTPSTSPTQLT